MGKIDSTSKVFVQKPEVFQDVFKLVFCDVQMAIRELKPMDPESLFIQRLPGGGKDKRNRKRNRAQKGLLLANFSRDMMKTCLCATDDEADYMILGIENQSYMDKFMPARVMIYDALTLHTQMQAFKAENKPGCSSSQFLSGISPEVKLKPVITVVCYFGTKPWDGPRCLHEILDIKNPKLKVFVPDYPIYIIDPHTLSDAQLEVLDTSLREVFMCIKASQDRKKLKEIVNSSVRFQHMDPDAANLIYAALNIDISVNTNQKEINMCQAVEEWKQELLDEGYANGERDGYASGERDGYASGERDGYANGERDGYASGERDGYASGERDGYANGEKDGIEKGEKIGIDKEKHNIAQNMILMDCFKYEDISRVTGLSIDRIHEIKETM